MKYSHGASRCFIALRNAMATDTTDSAASLPLPSEALARVTELPAVLHAAVAVGYCFLLRVSEYTGSGSHTVRFGDVALLPANADGVEQLRLTTRRRKNNPDRYPVTFTRDAEPDMAACPVRAWRTYLATPAGSTAHPLDPIFQRSPGVPLLPSDVTGAIRYLMLRASAQLAIPAADLPKYTPHSLRSGSASAAWRAGRQMLWIQQQGHWHSASSLSHYCFLRPGDDGDATRDLLAPRSAASAAPTRAPVLSAASRALAPPAAALRGIYGLMGGERECAQQGDLEAHELPQPMEDDDV
jgi:hypothetical protein